MSFKNTTVWLHIVIMGFVWIWEQTAIISLYSIDWLVFITETECVYCAVRSTFHALPTQCIYVFCVDLRTNSDYFTVQHWLIGFYNREGVCLLRFTDWVFKSLKGRAMDQAISCPSLTAEPRVRFQVSPCEIYGGQSSTGQVFLQWLQFSPVSIIPPTLHTHTH
jgi:hypothetical protein